MLENTNHFYNNLNFRDYNFNRSINAHKRHTTIDNIKNGQKKNTSILMNISIFGIQQFLKPSCMKKSWCKDETVFFVLSLQPSVIWLIFSKMFVYSQLVPSALGLLRSGSPFAHVSFCCLIPQNGNWTQTFFLVIQFKLQV